MDAKTVVRADAVFEAGLGLALIVGAATGALGSADFSRPVGTVLLVVFGALLVLLGFVLWGGWIGVKALALGNLLTGVASLVWLVGAAGFSAAGVAVLVVAVVGLVSLAAAQAGRGG